eukprot:1989316-Rhodomonas_salina.2
MELLVSCVRSSVSPVRRLWDTTSHAHAFPDAAWLARPPFFLLSSQPITPHLGHTPPHVHVHSPRLVDRPDGFILVFPIVGSPPGAGGEGVVLGSMQLRFACAASVPRSAQQ